MDGCGCRLIRGVYCSHSNSDIATALAQRADIAVVESLSYCIAPAFKESAHGPYSWQFGDL
jgi:hypothetical protein